MIWPRSLATADRTLTRLPADVDALRRWEESLDALQREVEAALGSPGGAPAAGGAPADGEAAAGAWTAPADLGPLPGPLLDRARVLAGLQEQALGVLAESRAGVERELAALVQARREVRPVYVDVAG